MHVGNPLLVRPCAADGEAKAHVVEMVVRQIGALGPQRSVARLNVLNSELGLSLSGPQDQQRNDEGERKTEHGSPPEIRIVAPLICFQTSSVNSTRGQARQVGLNKRSA